MTTIHITNNSPLARGFVNFAKMLPFADVVPDVPQKKMTFEEACAECDAVSVEEFIEEVKAEIRKVYSEKKNVAQG